MQDRSRHDLRLELVALRQQVGVLKRKNPRPKLSRWDRLFWLGLRRWWSKMGEGSRCPEEGDTHGPCGRTKAGRDRQGRGRTAGRRLASSLSLANRRLKGWLLQAAAPLRVLSMK
jgi:hypothetical protein